MFRDIVRWRYASQQVEFLNACACACGDRKLGSAATQDQEVYVLRYLDMFLEEEASRKLSWFFCEMVMILRFRTCSAILGVRRISWGLPNVAKFHGRDGSAATVYKSAVFPREDYVTGNDRTMFI